MKKFIEFIICCFIASIILYLLYTNRDNIFNQAKEIVKNTVNEMENTAVIEEKISEVVKSEDIDNTNNVGNNNIEDEVIVINLTDISGNKTKYSFEYNGETFYATYTPDNWHIDDSYKIKKSNAIEKICEELIAIHPIHGRDLVSYRTVEDLVYEWQQHNIAYDFLEEDNQWKEHAKNVDLNPEDQYLTFKEMYEVRTGKKIDYSEIKDKAKQRIKSRINN